MKTIHFLLAGLMATVVLVPELEWPAMTFQAPDVALADFKPGDQVAFELSASSLTATVTALKGKFT